MSRTVSRQFGSSSDVMRSGFTVEEKIWENPDTTAQFGATTLNLNLSKYDAIRFVTIGDNVGNDKIFINSICRKGELTTFRINSSNGTNLAWLTRDVEVGESTVIISACTRRTQGSSTLTTVNQFQIPSVIYGVRFSSASGSGGGVVDTGTPAVEELQPVITKTSGNSSVNWVKAYRYGGVIQVYVEFLSGNSVNAGSNAFVGTISGIPRPNINPVGCGFLSTSALLGYIGTDGTIAIRVLAATKGSSSTNTYGVSFTYVSDNNLM